MRIAQKEIKPFQKKILRWYTKNKRDLPWRETREPYHILVSEVMLQQTQVSRVIPKFEAWLKELPTIDHLARASVTDVLRLWSGLGYNRRALYLKKAAETVVKDYHGQFPRDEETLRKISVIGEYTARALLCFAFNEQVAVVDTNIRKVLTHAFFKGEPPENRELQTIAEEILPRGMAYEWNQALMDYARLEMAGEKVPIPKQSKFIGSNRYYRGKTIKYLLQHKKLSLSQLVTLLGKEEGFLQEILEGLIKDGLVKRNGKNISLVSS